MPNVYKTDICEKHGETLHIRIFKEDEESFVCLECLGNDKQDFQKILEDSPE